MLIWSRFFGYGSDVTLRVSADGVLGSDVHVGLVRTGVVREQLRGHGLYDGNRLECVYALYGFLYIAGEDLESWWRRYGGVGCMHSYLADVEVRFGEFKSDNDAFDCLDISVSYEYDEWGNIIEWYVSPPADLSAGWYISAVRDRVFYLSIVADYDPHVPYEGYLRGCYVGGYVGKNSQWLSSAGMDYGSFTLSERSDPEYVAGSGVEVMRVASGFLQFV